MPARASRHWLIISYFANESGMACSHHIDDRLLLLEKKGIEATLLTAACVNKAKGFRHLRMPSMSPSGIRFEVRQFLKRKKLSHLLFKLFETVLLLPVYPFYFLEKLLINIDTTWFWLFPAFFRGYLHCLFRPPELIYSTGGPASAHMVAGLLARSAGVKWIAEFQDPLIHSYCARSRIELRLFERVERYVCARADSVVFLTAFALARSLERTGYVRRGEVIYPGARPQPQAGAIYNDSNCLTFAHFGSLGGSRNLESFLAALQSVFDENPDLPEVVRLSLYGSLDSDVRRQVEEFPFPQSLLVQGQVSRNESVARMQGSDVLLLIQNRDEISSETIPSKVYEYLHAGRPILGLVYRNVELADMLADLGHVPVDLCDISSIMAGILDCVELWRSKKLLRQTNPSTFTSESAVEKLVSLAKNLKT